jgi:hypothetical protein
MSVVRQVDSNVSEESVSSTFMVNMQAASFSEKLFPNLRKCTAHT